jgi:hypothetical protein
LGDALEQAIVETATVNFADANVTLTLSDSNARQDARALRLNLAGSTSGARDLIVPAIQKPYLVNNGTADTITVKVSGQTGVAVPASTSMLLYNNGTDVIVAFNRVVANVVGNVTGNVTGTASNATVLQTARNIQISGNVTAANVSFDGSAAVNLNVTDINASGITSGTLGVARGGTGASTLTSENVIIGNGTSAVKFVAPGTSGNVLTSNGSAWLSQAISAGGDYIRRVYTSPATWTKPAGLKAVSITVLAGGGGGGGVTAIPAPAFSGKQGGRGGNARQPGSFNYLAAPSIPGPVAVTVGAGGTPGPTAGGNGGAGGTSSFGPFLSATGGGAGVGATANGAVGADGALGGLTTGPALGIVQYNDGPGAQPGISRHSFGIAGLPRLQGSPKNGIGRGSGGAGGASESAPPSFLPADAGGAGAAGFVIVEEFY